MAEQAKVTSLEALETFRGNLIVFLNRAHRAVDEVKDEIRRTRQWLQHEQKMHWLGEARRWKRVLDQAEQELLSAKLSGLRNSTTLQEQAVHKAKRALTHAEEKIRAVQIWTRDFDHLIDPLTRRLESLRQVLDHDLPKGLAVLVQTQRTLEAYAEVAPPAAPPPGPRED